MRRTYVGICQKVMNSLFAIAPYKFEGFWVFDDPSVGLRQEPFVSGADTIIDILGEETERRTRRRQAGMKPLKRFSILKVLQKEARTIKRTIVRFIGRKCFTFMYGNVRAFIPSDRGRDSAGGLCARWSGRRGRFWYCKCALLSGF